MEQTWPITIIRWRGPLYLLIDQSGDPSIQKVIDFALGEEGQDIVARYHVPIR